MDQERRGDTALLLRALGDAWLLEPDAAMLDRLSSLQQPQGEASTATTATLAIAYSELFLQLVPPYASMFLSPDGMLNGEPADEALRAYSRAGFDISAGWRAGAADHMGVELHFLARLTETGSPYAKTFLHDHVLTWAPICCLAVERAQVDPLFTGLGRLTCDVLLALESDSSPEGG